MNVNCAAGASGSWTLEACDKSDKMWAVREKDCRDERDGGGGQKE